MTSTGNCCATSTQRSSRGLSPSGFPRRRSRARSRSGRRFYLRPEDARRGGGQIPACLDRPGLGAAAIEDQIKGAYRRLARQHHLDQRATPRYSSSLRKRTARRWDWPAGERIMKKQTPLCAEGWAELKHHRSEIMRVS
jgi:hypothetical protein